MSDLYPTIADVSKWQGTIDWDKAKSYLHFVYIRVQDGSTEDTQHARNTSECERLGIPYYLYGYYRGGGASEAENLCKRAGSVPNCLGAILDLEESGYNAAGIKSALQIYKNTYGRAGLYISHNLVSKYGTDFEQDFTVIPRYGANTGYPDVQPSYPCDLWQFTSKGTVPGISGNVDLNACVNKSLSWFLKQDETPKLPDNLKNFTDLTGSEWYIGAASQAVADGIISGYPNGRFGAEDACNRAQALIMVLRAYGANYKSTFDDVQPANYYYEAVEYGASHGIISTEYENYRPEDTATRQEVCAMIYNAFAKGETVENGDTGGADAWAETAVAWCVANEIIGKGTDVRPKDGATRIEVAIMADRAYTKFRK